MFWPKASILWKSSRIFFRAKELEHFIEQVSIIAIYLLKNNDGRVSSVLKKMGILSFFVVSLCWNIFPSFLHQKEINICLKRCCVNIKYRREKRTRNKQKIQMKNCCWNRVVFFSVLYSVCISVFLFLNFLIGRRKEMKQKMNF